MEIDKFTFEKSKMNNKLFKNRYFLSAVQFFTLIVFVLLIYGAIGVATDDSGFAKILRNTNLSNLIVWSYWWPLIIVTAIIFGRFWCSICPMELITSFFGKIGLRRKPWKYLKSGWVTTVFYAVILVVGIHTLAIHRIPMYMAIYMIVLLITAIISGLIWEKRTFCTYICPIGHLLGLYSLLSFKKLKVIDQNVCKKCETKSCISKESHYKFIERSCTSELFPPKLKDNRSCILCGQCFKSCSNDNIVIQKQRIAADMFGNIKLSWAEISFFLIVSGFVVYEILSEWKVSKKIVMAIPNFINSVFQVSNRFEGTVKALTLFVFLPFIFYFIPVLLKKYFARETWKGAFTQLILAVLPVTASMHLLKALLKTTSRIPYWNYVMSDPEGVKTADLIMNNPDMLNRGFLTSYISPAVGFFALVLPLAGLILSLLIIRKQEYANKLSRALTILTVLIYSSIFITTLTIWKIT